MIWFIVSTFSLIIISITMFYRANDLRWRPEPKWQVRLVGFMLAGVMPVGVVGTEWYFSEWPSPYEAFFRAGLMLVFITTPQLPPWWKWISGQEQANDTN